MIYLATLYDFEAMPPWWLLLIVIVIMGIILIGIIGFGIDVNMRRLEEWLVPWKGRS